jgi:hypothetical protein
MNKAALQIGQVKGLGAGTEVTVPVHKAFQKSVCRSKHRICSEVELAAIHQQGLFNILLNN